jgi:short-subunit dehydrogenase
VTTDSTFRDRYGPWAVVAGGSDGTGAAFTRQLAERGLDVAIVARRAPLLEELAAEVRDEYGVDARAVVVDLSAPDALAQLRAGTDDLEVGLLVYNAGADERMATFLDVAADDHLAMVRRNCVTVLQAVHHFGTPMIARGHGGAVLVTSGAAWAGGSHLAVYGATKAFDLVLGEALWAEWHERGVDVLSLVLGSTETPSYRNLLDRHGRDFPPGADPAVVVAEALDHLADGPTWAAGSPDPGAGSPFGALPRRQAVELMSQGAKALLPDQAADDAS